MEKVTVDMEVPMSLQQFIFSPFGYMPSGRIAVIVNLFLKKIKVLIKI